jgi:AcrR family transcriptional regulator
MTTKVLRNKKISMAKERAEPSGSLRAELKRFTRDKIITAAMVSFATDGFRATTVERIVELAGTTAPTFYRHFTSKNDLLHPLQDHLSVEVGKTMMLLEKIERVDFPSIRTWLDQYADMWQRVHRLCSAYWEAGNLDPNFLADAIPASRRTVLQLERFLERFAGRDRHIVEIRLTLVVPLLDRVIQVSDAMKDRNLCKEVLDQFAQMLVLALTVPSQAVSPGGCKQPLARSRTPKAK